MDLEGLIHLETPDLFHIITVIVGILHRRFLRRLPLRGPQSVQADIESGVAVADLECIDYQIITDNSFSVQCRIGR